MPEFAWTNSEHAEPTDTDPGVVGVISPEEPVQLDQPEVPFETAVIMSLNAVHDRLDAIGSQNDWLVTAAQHIVGTTDWIRTTVEGLVSGMMASPMGAMLKNKLPKIG
jgi:hypothetical protein